MGDHPPSLAIAADLRNLLDGMQIATIFLDAAGRIRSFTSSVTCIYDICEGDIGRPLHEVPVHAAAMPDVPSMGTFEEPVEDEIETKDGRWFLRRVLPYHDGDASGGMILTFVDISRRKQDEMRLATRYGVADLLASATSLEEVIPQLLRTLCETLETDVGILWMVDHSDNRLHCTDLHIRRADRSIDAFARRCRELRFASGDGLPGYVWQTNEPCWIADVSKSLHMPIEVFRRLEDVKRAGQVGAIAMPIVSENTLHGVLEFFASRDLQKEGSLLQMLRDVLHEISQFIRRQQLDASFRDEEARKTAILQAALDCIVTMDTEGRIVDFNHVAEETYGYSKEDVVGKPLADFLIPPDQRSAHRNGFKRFLETGEKVVIGRRVELMSLRADGTQFPVELAISVSHSRDGTPFFTAFLRDITKRRESQEQLAMLAAIAEQTTDFVNIVDLQGQAIFVNSAGRRAIGIEPDFPASELRVANFFFPEDMERVNAILHTAMTEGQAAGEFQFRSFETGEPIDFYWNVFRIDDPSTEKPIALGSVSQDIRERKRYEAELLQSRHAAEAASLAKSEFLANMSHEIRTPMTAVLGYADLLVANEDDPEKLQYLDTIRRNGSFLLGIINDILDYSKIEAGKFEITHERFSISELVNEVQSMMHVWAADDQLEFRVQYDGQLPAQIESDPKRVKQILINLVGNGIKFTEKGSVRLRVKLIEQEGSPMIRFDVIDTGIGMTPEQQSRLFESFSQGDPSVTRSFGGTGLGLAISKRLSTMLGGDITVSSEAAKGSTFTCTISAGDIRDVPLVDPLHHVTSVHSGDIHSGDKENQKPEVRLSCHVLVVDDRRDVRFLTHRILSSAGATVEEAEDGLEALKRFKDGESAFESIDLVLLDMQMPRLDGYQTATKLRQLGYSRPIVALTADAMQRDMSRCLKAGCDDFLSKPINKQKLLQLIERLTRSEG